MCQPASRRRGQSRRQRVPGRLRHLLQTPGRRRQIDVHPGPRVRKACKCGWDHPCMTSGCPKTYALFSPLLVHHSLRFRVHATSVSSFYPETEDLATSSATPRSSLFSLSLWLGRTAGRIFGARPGPSISPSGRMKYGMPKMCPKQNLLENGTEKMISFLICCQTLQRLLVKVASFQLHRGSV